MGWSMQGFTSLTIPEGATSGARIVIGDQVNGFAIAVYNSSNQLIFSIDQGGSAISYNYTQFPAPAVMTTELIQGSLGSQVDNSNGESMNATITRVVNPTDQPEYTFLVACAGGTAGVLSIRGGSKNGANNATLTGLERNVSGSLVQSDQVSTNNLLHFAAISGTTDGSGFLTFNHGAGFTPAFIFTQVHDQGTPTFGMVDIINGSITSSQARGFFVQFGGAARANATVNFWIMCVG